MATLILSAAGRAVAGPIGQAVGALIGQQIDRAIFAPKTREGPRLGDFSVQSSSYGTPIPKLFGAVRVSGTVIWATDLIETQTTQSNGKGKPKTNNYSYRASFAVVLSARPIVGVGRIWADGNLLRGQGGDFKVQTGFTLYHGTQIQAIDPRIASVEGIANCSAYRGMAYAVFEDFQLGDYGNRIPSLSFEVFADEGALSVGAIIEDLSGGSIKHEAPTLIDGLAATGDSVRGVAETLIGAIPLSLIDQGSHLLVREGGPAAVPIDEIMLGTDINDQRSPRIMTERGSTLAETLSIGYYDAARDYQPGLQSARRDGGARRGTRFDLPVTITAATAKAFAEHRLTELWAQRIRARVKVPWHFLGMRAGDRVSLPGSGTTWRIATITLERMVIALDLIPISAAISVGFADAGRSLAQTDQLHGPTHIELIDAPPLSETAPTETTLFVAAAGTSPGWRRAALLVSNDAGLSWVDAGQTAAPAVIGSATSLIGAGSAAVIDRSSSLDVQLLNEAMTLTDTDDTGLLAGANLAMFGRELIQFGRAFPLGMGKWRLSTILRGRRGTEAAMTGHMIGDRFVVLNAESLLAIDARFALSGVQIMAVGIGDGPAPPRVTADDIGAAILPLSPVHPRVERQSSGDILLTWIRRSREGWPWPDYRDVPLAEDSEQYRITVTPLGSAPRIFVEPMPRFIYSAADQAQDILGGAGQTAVTISQLGARGLSPPLLLTLSLI